MRSLMRGGVHHVCLPCLLRARRPLPIDQCEFLYAIQTIPSRTKRTSYSTSNTTQQDNYKSSRNALPLNPTRRNLSSKIRRVPSRNDVEGGQPAANGNKKGFATAVASAKSGAIELTMEQIQRLRAINNLKNKIQTGLSKEQKQALNAGNRNLPVETVLEAISSESLSREEALLVPSIAKEYAGRPYIDLRADLLRISTIYGTESQYRVRSKKTVEILGQVGVLTKDVTLDDKKTPTALTSDENTAAIAPALEQQTLTEAPVSEEKTRTIIPVSGKTTSPSTTVVARSVAGRTRRSLVKTFGLAKPAKTSPETAAVERQRAARVDLNLPSFPERPKLLTIAAADLAVQHVDIGEETKIPELSFDLSRVLFNPGIYHLRDPRSRVYNFDPYLEAPMPLSEFNFDALNAYKTSSEDSKLMTLARDLGKRYVGSSSSMSSALCQFHFLISQWRELNIMDLSKGFGEIVKTFTNINRVPAAIFLRYRDGVYAVDADKEHDEPNVLMSLGKLLEKLLTLEKDEIEKWRKTHTVADKEFFDDQSDAFHYSQLGGFLLRSQLDARDPRLPGSGVFDLKTRAVAGIRMNMREYEQGKGYEIRDRFGTWESYEREYYDMIRSTFLKYSMQVRMGNMDGIFVAYHNIERLFGFQYIPLNDIDNAVHGQRDTCLGDQEFRFSVNFMNEIFDLATKECPEQSLRFHFATREASPGEPTPYMHIFAEPMTNEEIDKIQTKKHESFAEYEKKLFNGENADQVSSDLKTELEGSEAAIDDMFASLSDTLSGREPDSPASPSSSSNAADTVFLDKVIESTPPNATAKQPRPVMGWRFKIQNVVNGTLVVRPSRLEPTDEWAIRYTIERMSDDNARRLCVFAKNQRMKAMSFSQSNSGFFFRKLASLAATGAEWRQQQNDIDSQTEPVVLYQNSDKSEQKSM